jgi:hypothetical protein
MFVSYFLVITVGHNVTRFFAIKTKVVLATEGSKGYLSGGSGSV